MDRTPRAAWLVPAVLLFLTALPILMALMRLWEIPRGGLPADSVHLAATPVAIFAHVAAGAVFGLLGPWQFHAAFRRRFGRAHQLTGRLFGVAGLIMAASGLRLVWAHAETASPLVDSARVAFSVGLIAAIALGVQAIRLRDRSGHRDWMIRAYALGMGTAPIALIFIPILIVTGAPPMGALADVLFIGTWAASIAAAEAVIHHLRRPALIPTW